MPTIKELLDSYDIKGSYTWETLGEEWSSDWGGTDMEWHGTLLPRIHAFLPSSSILEIGCGFGRWTNLLKDACDKLTAVDLSQKCVDACAVRFEASKHASFHTTDGSSLKMLPDHSVDFIFSFDSLVHADMEVIEGYLVEFARVLKPDGIGFIHHSNLAQYSSYFSFINRIPCAKVLRKANIIEKTDHWRDRSVSASKFLSSARAASLHVISQELISWLGTRRTIDCISVFTPAGSPKARQFTLLKNPNFNPEVARMAMLSKLYSAKRFQVSEDTH